MSEYLEAIEDGSICAGCGVALPGNEIPWSYCDDKDCKDEEDL